MFRLFKGFEFTLFSRNTFRRWIREGAGAGWHGKWISVSLHRTRSTLNFKEKFKFFGVIAYLTFCKLTRFTSVLFCFCFLNIWSKWDRWRYTGFHSLEVEKLSLTSACLSPPCSCSTFPLYTPSASGKLEITAAVTRTASVGEFVWIWSGQAIRWVITDWRTSTSAVFHVPTNMTGLSRETESFWGPLPC